MSENSNNENENDIPSSELSDEEIHVYSTDDLNFSDEAFDGETVETTIVDVSDTGSRTVKSKKVKSKKSRKNNKDKKVKNTKKDKPNKKDRKPKKVNEKEKQSKRNVGMILIILLLVAGAIFASWEFYFSFDEYNPFDYIQIVEKGADTQAYLEIEKDEIVSDDRASLVRDLSEFAIIKNQDLSIGDVREINVILDEAAKDKFKKEKIRINPLNMSYTVGDVSELENIDVFESLDIEYEIEGNKVTVIEMKPQVSDLDLRDLLVFETTDKGLAFEEKFIVEVKDSPSLEAYLVEHGYKIDDMEKEFTVEAFDYVPDTIDNLSNVDQMKTDALESLKKDLNSKEELYENFSVKEVCYTNDALNEENTRDKNFMHEYTKGSLMFIVEFNETNDEEKTLYADAIGYTNILMKGHDIDQNQILEMNPLYEKATYEIVKRDMVQNNFDCQ